MGYVPSRKYEGVVGNFTKGILTIFLPSTFEDAWFFSHQWLREKKRVEAVEVDEGGCELKVKLVDARQARPLIIENLTVEITAQGLVMIGTLVERGASLSPINHLRIAAGQEMSTERMLLLTFE